MNRCSDSLKNLRSLSLEIEKSLYFNDPAHKWDEFVVALEAKMVTNIEELPAVEGFLRVERKRFLGYDTRILTWRAKSDAKFGLAKGIQNMRLDEGLRRIEFVEN